MNKSRIKKILTYVFLILWAVIVLFPLPDSTSAASHSRTPSLIPSRVQASSVMTSTLTVLPSSGARSRDFRERETEEVSSGSGPGCGSSLPLHAKRKAAVVSNMNKCLYFIAIQFYSQKISGGFWSSSDRAEL